VREWATFPDPEDPHRRWQVDVTWLTSPWRCVFGCGCQGVLTGPTPEMQQGCCSYGAHFSDEEDRDRVVAAAADLRADEWQHQASGIRKGVTARLAAGGWRTRLVEGACVFLNRPGFPAGAGCALHVLALRQGVHFVATKPDVCWQLPLRKEDSEESDGTVTTTLSEFGRSGWGPGGEEFAWWCTEAPEAFTGTDPVYRSMEVELRAMVGDALYEAIAAYLDRRMAASAGAVNGAGGAVLVPHPAVRKPSRPARRPVLGRPGEGTAAVDDDDLPGDPRRGA
jgi:hypothetical protein